MTTRRWGVAVALGVGVIVVLAALAAALTYSPLFEASTIRVEGSSRPDQQIIEAAGIQLGMNVYHLDADAAARLLMTDPWIRSASVRRQLPTTIVIEVSERSPVIVVAGQAVAADGTLLPGSPTAGLPEARMDIGEEVGADAIRWAASAAGSLDAQTQARLEYIVISYLDGTLSLRLRDGPPVRWGGPGDEVEKAAAVRALLDIHDRGRTMTSIDVSVPGSPSARFED